MKHTSELLTYDSAHAELQQIITELQNEAIGIDELAARIERASVLILFCREKLREVEGKVQEMLF
ncbi:MAG: exodeoxyribonuclease VII small subunit [Lewinellaceae bacterium]|nr:exodeoxyribonuclease VII small subunit [Lewinellaceae bacterium]